MKNFHIVSAVHPGQHLHNVAENQGVDPQAIMRDYLEITQESPEFENGPELGIIAVGDMANNIVGGPFEHPELAESANLPGDYQFNGGLIGSLVLRKAVGLSSTTGPKLIGLANYVLDGAYRSLGMRPGNLLDPAERFTGYLTHARIDDRTTTLTTVGDVYAWVNGELVAGAEKVVDIKKNYLVSNLEKALALPEDQRGTHVGNIIGEFAKSARWDDALTRELFDEVTSAIDDAQTPNRQTVYRPVDTVATLWQIRQLQNQPSDTHPWAYGAIDGTATPAEYITTQSFTTPDIETLVIATDGSRPSNPQGRVTSLEDLEAVNPVFSERTAVALERPKT